MRALRGRGRTDIIDPVVMSSPKPRWCEKA